MRAISTEPEFSWAGTLLILGFATWLGVGCGILAAARADGRRRGWALVGLPGLLLFAGPGMLFLPAFAFGGLAISARAVGWRVLGALAVIGPVYLTWRLTAEDSFSDDGSVLFAVAGFAMLSVGLASAGAAIWTRGGPTSVPLWAPTRSQEVDGPLPSGHKPSAPVGAATTGGPPTASP